MSRESKDGDFPHHKSSLSNSPKSDESNSASECEEIRTSGFKAYNGMQRSGMPKLILKNSYENLESLYICKVDKSKLYGKRKICSGEQPLDFSKKSSSAVKENGLPPYTADDSSTCPKNSALPVNGLKLNTADDYNSFPKVSAAQANGLFLNSADDSWRPIKNEFNILDYADNSTVEAVSALRNLFDARAIKRRIPEIPIPWCIGRVSLRDEFKMKRLRADTSSESEEEFHTVYSSSNFEQANNRLHLDPPCVDPLPTKENHLPLAINKIPHVPNGNLENGSDSLTLKNDRFLIKDLLSPQSTSQTEPTQTAKDLNDSSLQPRISFQSPSRDDNFSSKPQSTSRDDNFSSKPQSTSREDCLSSKSQSTSREDSLSPGPQSTSREDNLSSFTPTSQSIHLPPTGFPVGVGGQTYATNGIYAPYVQTVFPPSPFPNFVNHMSPDIQDYSRMFSYPPEAMLQPPFNPMYAQSYQKTLQAGQNKQRLKEQRPFKTIDTSAILSHLSLPQSAAVLQKVGLSLDNASSTAATTSSSPQRLSPDSQCLADSSPVSSTEMAPQDTNNEPGRKTVRRIPPEEKDEKYLEKRRKNNLAAKKSRDERRKKEDLLAASAEGLAKDNAALLAENKFLTKSLRDKEMRLDVIKSKLITFREKCDGRARELFEDTFSFPFSATGMI